MQLILASASPRRAELLGSSGFEFTVRPANVDERYYPDESPEEYVVRVARDKAAAVADASRNGSIVLAADTVVVARGEILGKPADRLDALRMLKLLAGAVHEVFTGVVVASPDQELATAVCTRVSLLPLTLDEINWYLDTGEPAGKAGAYAIQGHAARFIDRIEGSWSNVVGLPIATVYQLLKRVGAWRS
jgi:nucleoside triphosphate pyrophosphatase